MPLLLKMKTTGFIFTAFLIFIASCSPGPAKKENTKTEPGKNNIDSVQTKTIADVATILAKKKYLFYVITTFVRQSRDKVKL